MHSYQSSSSASSPTRESDELEEAEIDFVNIKARSDSFPVDDVDMWEVLEALEVPSPGLPHLSNEDPFLSALQPQPPAAPSPAAAASVTPPANCFTSGGLQSAPASAAKRPITGVDLIACQDPPETAFGTEATTGSASASGAEENRDSSLDPTEEKRLKRMRRNRESAAMSRNRKKAYIEELETKVACISNSLSMLQGENGRLKEENATLRAQLGLPPMPAQTPPAASAQPNADSLVVKGEVKAEVTAPSAESGVATDVGAGAVSSSSGEGSHGKKHTNTLSTTGLALMSALTFVTFSASSSGSSAFNAASAHMGRSPVARALLSIGDEPLVRTADEAPLWPSLGLLKGAHHHAATEHYAPPTQVALPMRALASPSPEQEHTLPHPSSERVVRLPPNSSWADALRTEAADARLQEMQLAPGTANAGAHGTHVHAGAHGTHGRATYVQESHRVYEPQWDETEEYEPAPGAEKFVFDESAFESFDEAKRRYIFCARAYTFDVAGTGASKQTPTPTSTELQIAAMPARFRHAAMRAGAVPQLTGGNASGDEGAASGRLPVVSLLMPSAALRGVLQTEHPHDRPWNPSPPPVDDSLVQVSCQVLNATRLTR